MQSPSSHTGRQVSFNSRGETQWLRGSRATERKHLSKGVELQDSQTAIDNDFLLKYKVTQLSLLPVFNLEVRSFKLAWQICLTDQISSLPQ